MEEKKHTEIKWLGTSLVVQCLRLHTPQCRGRGFYPGNSSAASKSSHAATKYPEC